MRCGGLSRSQLDHAQSVGPGANVRKAPGIPGFLMDVSRLGRVVRRAVMDNNNHATDFDRDDVNIDVNIVGAGLGGLTAAALAELHGLRRSTSATAGRITARPDCPWSAPIASPASSSTSPPAWSSGRRDHSSSTSSGSTNEPVWSSPSTARRSRRSRSRPSTDASIGSTHHHPSPPGWPLTLSLTHRAPVLFAETCEKRTESPVFVWCVRTASGGRGRGRRR